MKEQQYFCADLSSDNILLPEATARHLAQVLRMQVGDKLLLGDGKGTIALVAITVVTKKAVQVQLIQKYFIAPKPISINLGIAFTKNATRMEWLLEKATEIGVENIYPIICQRGEHGKIKEERWHSILTSATNQSKQAYIPKLHAPIALHKALKIHETNFIAHCLPTPKEPLLNCTLNKSSLILIGPEGDFTTEEVSLCTEAGAIAVSLGSNRLRTETAGMVALTLMNTKI